MDEERAYRENFPAAWGDVTSATRLNFRMNEVMKFPLMDQLQRPEVDVMMFHCHGSPTSQWINWSYMGDGFATHYEAMRISAYNTVRRAIKNEKESKEEVITRYAKEFEVTEAFFDKLYDPQFMRDDSIKGANSYIRTADLKEINTHPRFVMNNSCDNGSFHLDDYISGYYIFNNGNTVVAQGNSRNVLQDRWTIEMIGLLSHGARIGQWNRMIATLEGHLFGDPTFRFTAPGCLATDLAVGREKPAVWQKYINSNVPDLQSVGMRMMCDADKKMVCSSQLLSIFIHSPYNEVRIEALRLLSRYRNHNFVQAVKIALYDPYELVTRHAALYAGAMGNQELLDIIADIYVNYPERQRVHYHINSALPLYPFTEVKHAITEVVMNSSIMDKEAAISAIFSPEDSWRSFVSSVDWEAKSHEKIRDSSVDPLERIDAIRSVRNNNYHFRVDDYLKLVANPEEDTKVRIVMAEALGWFIHSYRRVEIINALQKIGANKLTPKELAGEITQTIIRLK
jgi:hypothetical protein